jgi:uncharacterized membrane protein
MQDSSQHLRFHTEHVHLGTPFGGGWFGKLAESIARFFGTPFYLIGQSLLVMAWIVMNGFAIAGTQFDPYPFILLNLAFSLQAAYAAPLILLAQTRQAERDKMWSDADARHREDLSTQMLTLLQQNTELTQEVRQLSGEVQRLTQDIHQRVVTA